MDQPQFTPPFVKQADKDYVLVHVADDSLCAGLESLGFMRVSTEDREMRIATPSKEDKAHLLSTLRDRGFHFSRGREWSPAEIFEWLRDQKLVSGTFSEIYWLNPHSWRIRDNV